MFSVDTGPCAPYTNAGVVLGHVDWPTHGTTIVLPEKPPVKPEEPVKPEPPVEKPPVEPEKPAIKNVDFFLHNFDHRCSNYKDANGEWTRTFVKSNSPQECANKCAAEADNCNFFSYGYEGKFTVGAQMYCLFNKPGCKLEPWKGYASYTITDPAKAKPEPVPEVKPEPVPEVKPEPVPVEKKPEPVTDEVVDTNNVKYKEAGTNKRCSNYKNSAGDWTRSWLTVESVQECANVCKEKAGSGCNMFSVGTEVKGGKKN